MYSLRDFGDMLADAQRLTAYAAAIAAAVRPGDVVVEIGAGPGVFSLLACKAGARRVFAIESDSSIQFARELAAANAFSDRIEFIEQDSRAVNLPERANVIVSDIRGVLPLFGTAVLAQEDARQRFLAPGGILIPQRDTLKGALVEAEPSYSRLLSPWRSPNGLDLTRMHPYILNQFQKVRVPSKQLLTDAREWTVLDYTSGDSPRVGAEMEFVVERDGTAHGICLWFDAQLFANIGFTCAPGTDTIYGQQFLPWLQPVALQRGEKIHVALHADFVARDYVWRWETRIPAGEMRSELHFRQSTFYGEIYEPKSLHRQALDFAPALSESGLADLWLLQRMDGRASLQQIAHLARETFPAVFHSWQQAFERAATLSAKCSR